MPAALPDRAGLMARIEALLRKGATREWLAAQPDLPCRRTVLNWALADPNFRWRLDEAQRAGAAVRAEARKLHGYTYDKAEAFLRRVRLGERVGDLVRTPGLPTREALDRWRREHPEFRHALTEATRFARFGRRRAPRYSEAMSDRVILALVRGAPVRRLAREPGMPGPTTLAAWRRRHPEFDGAVRIAVFAAHRARMKARRITEDEAVVDAVCLHIFCGGTLHSASQQPGLPRAGALYKGMKRDPAFAARVREAYADRDFFLLGEARGAGPNARGYPGRRTGEG